MGWVLFHHRDTETQRSSLCLCVSVVGLCLVLLPASFGQAPNGRGRGFSAAPGLEVTLWASGPQITRASAIDIDARGRVWVVDGAAGRITILEDADGDGKAEKVKVFDEDARLRSSSGIGVFGEKVMVWQPGECLHYTVDASDRILSRNVAAGGWKGIRSLAFAPEGRWYMSTAESVKRMDSDGTGSIFYAHKFRNPTGIAVDSFGNVWQADDDEVDAQSHINYVLQGGRYDNWGSAVDWPGSVPFIGRIRGGSSPGMVVYEGKLLPQKYRGHLMRADAGKRTISAYLLKRDDSGFKLTAENMVSTPDPLFRPSDLKVGPDGAVYFSDSYVEAGSEARKSEERGRIYRLAPAGSKVKTPALSFDSDEGLASALRSPAQSAHYLAYTTLQKRGVTAGALIRAMAESADTVARARALWLMDDAPVRDALSDPDPNLRVLALRILNARGADMLAAAKPLLHDPSPEVRREIAILLRNIPSEAAVDGVAEIARQWDGHDRLYLAALGIAGQAKENLLYAKLKPETWDPRFARLCREWRPQAALAELIERADEPEMLETLGAMPAPEAGRHVARLVEKPAVGELALSILGRQLFRDWSMLRGDPQITLTLRFALAEPRLQSGAIDLVRQLGDRVFGPDLLALVRSDTASEEVRSMAIEALGKTKAAEYIPELVRLLNGGTTAMRTSAVRAIAFIHPDNLDLEMRKVILSGAPNEVRSEAVRVLGRHESGIAVLVDLEQKEELPIELTSLVHFSGMRVPARKHAPLPATSIPREGDGNAKRGRQIFNSSHGPKCNSCHALGDGKRLAGPDLSAIGARLDREGLFDAIAHPSASISPEFYTWVLKTKSHGEIAGVILEDGPQRLVVRTETGDEVRVKSADIVTRRRRNVSMMPEGLPKAMTGQGIADLLEFLSTLKDPPLKRAAQVR